MFTRKIFYEITGHNALYSIMPLDNIFSVMQNGILSHELAKEYHHRSVASESVQDRRERKVTNTGRALHSYANVYFDAYNPMLSRLRDLNSEICILAINPEILNIEGAIVTDCNAASNIAQFVEPEQMTNVLNFDKIYMQYWLDSNCYIQDHNKLIKCAEVLIPDFIPPHYIFGAVVVNENVKQKLIELDFNLPIKVDRNRFF